MRKPNQIPDWAPQNPAKWPAGCTPYRDGWIRWYKGKSRHVCGKKTPVSEVEDCWIAIKVRIDSEAMPATIKLPPAAKTYRAVMSEFMAIQRARIGAEKRPIEPRTFHNYEVELNRFGNFIHQGEKVADTEFRVIGPHHLTAFAGEFVKWKASGFDSVVSRVGALFRWAVEMEYIERFRPGPEFRRPEKRDIRSQRIERTKSFTAAEVAAAYIAANHTMRCWIALGICAAFNNADIAHFNTEVYDPDTGLIDFRRRKKGKVRRVVPLPVDVRKMLADYDRPAPADPAWRKLVFISEEGNPYSRSTGVDYKPTDTISRLTSRLLDDADVTVKGDGRNFSGFRTTHYNLAPTDKWNLERTIVMGRAQGSIDLDHYLEKVGIDELRHYVSYVWSLVKTEIGALSILRKGPMNPGKPASA